VSCFCVSDLQIINMVEFPIELWLKICALACSDDGRTGCALSAVSHHIRAVSREYRYQSIAVAGYNQIRGLVATLSDRDPSHRSPVKHLCIHTYNRDGPLRVGRMLRDLLGAVASSVRTLTIVAITSRGPGETEPVTFKLTDYDFPQLEELSLRGVPTLTSSKTLAPLLGRLDACPSAFANSFIKDLAINHPRLTHVRVTGAVSFVIGGQLWTLVQLMGAMGLRPGPSPRDRKLILKSLSAVMPWPPSRYLAVEPGPGGSSYSLLQMNGTYRLALEMLQDICNHTPHFAVLPEDTDDSEEHVAGLAKERWLDRVGGGNGPWTFGEHSDMKT